MISPLPRSSLHVADALAAGDAVAGPGAVPGGEPGGPGLPGAQAEGARQGRSHERLQVSAIQGDNSGW